MNPFEQNKKFIIQELEENIPIVVITHHAPIYNSDMMTTYGTDLTDIMTDNIKLWIFGHTHEYYDQIASNSVTRLVNNPLVIHQNIQLII